MASLLDVLIFDAVYGSWILSLPLFTLDSGYFDSRGVFKQFNGLNIANNKA